MRDFVLLFDMDGVLVDSEPVITEASIRALAEWGVQAVPADFKAFTGMGEDAFIGGVSNAHGVPFVPEMKARTYEIYLEIVGEMIGLYDGVAPLFAQLKEENVRFALVSAADRVKVEANLACAGIPLESFAAIVSGNDVKRKKPAPDGFLAGAAAAGFEADKCIVIEDALSGIEAAHAAGMRCIAVTTSFPREVLLRGGADAVVDDVRDVLNAAKAL